MLKNHDKKKCLSTEGVKGNTIIAAKSSTPSLTHLSLSLPQVHMENQETHKFLRKHKAGIRLEEVRKPDSNYKRPKGFDNIPQAINEQRKKAPPVPVQKLMWGLK
ncbi:hypothetical protein E2C01_101767 [Portunus trituberculatus]|uniref:Uncharacterized protein n=1 Tax=Portunus trituberculatus TaxID=210409 RepID=A0A5B7KAM9_PORTR|nr:hypothetical protein [Portunus trituberculatus]